MALCKLGVTPDTPIYTEKGLCISFDARGLYNTHGQVESNELIKTVKGSLNLGTVKVCGIGNELVVHVTFQLFKFVFNRF